MKKFGVLSSFFESEKSPHGLINYESKAKKGECQLLHRILKTLLNPFSFHSQF